jgi:hypothetical protein
MLARANSNLLDWYKLGVGENVSTEAEDIVGIRQQATTNEDTAD